MDFPTLAGTQTFLIVPGAHGLPTKERPGPSRGCPCRCLFIHLDRHWHLPPLLPSGSEINSCLRKQHSTCSICGTCGQGLLGHTDLPAAVTCLGDRQDLGFIPVAPLGRVSEGSLVA